METLMIILHFVAALMATGRITELLTQDRITERMRNRWPIYLWTCPRCVSVWAGIWATVMFYFAPFVNWPFALSWLYLIINAMLAVLDSHAKKPGVRITPAPEGVNVDWAGYDPRVAITWLRKVVKMFDQPPVEAPVSMMEGKRR
jgi:hypothetical protein